MSQSSQLMGLLSQVLGGDTHRQLGVLVGADENQAGAALSAALPMLLSGLARNAQEPAGANALLGALSRDHDGSVLDDVDAGDLAGAAGLPGRLFGGR